MSRMKRIMMLVLVMVLSISLAIPVQAASGKKTVYVLTKNKTTGYDGNGSYRYNFTYNKKGYVTGVKYSDLKHKYTYKGSFEYNKKNQAIRETYNSYIHGVKNEDGYIKYKYTKKGYLSSAKSFYAYRTKKKTTYYLDYARYLSWDSVGKIKKVKLYLDDDEFENPTQWFKYNSNGDCISGHRIDANGTDYWIEYEQTSSGKRIIKEYDSKKSASDEEFEEEAREHSSKAVQTIKHGNVIYETVYGQEEVGKQYKRSFTYKKIKVNAKDYKKILKQQEVLYYMLDPISI